MRSSPSAYARLAALALGLASCGLFVSFGNYDTRETVAGDAGAVDGALLYAVKGTVDGLAGGKITLLLNGANPIDDVGEGGFVFPTAVPDGAGYVVTVKKDPPGRACTVIGGMGTIAGADVIGVAVHCIGAPTHPASFIRAADQDPTALSYDGLVTIGRATDESDVRTYELYWVTDALAKVARIASLAKTGADVILPRTGPVPPTATRLLVLTANSAGEMTAGLSVAPVDNFPVYADISAAQGASSGLSPKAVIDVVNRKLLVVTQNSPNALKPSLFRCDLDGTSCTHTDISAGQGTGSGGTPAIAIDAAAKKLLVVTDNAANSDKPSLFRCDLDGTSCTHTDISAGQGTNSGQSPTVVIDVAGSKLLVVTDNGANFRRPGLFRCNIDGTSCTHTDISGSVDSSGYSPSAVIDAANGKLLVVTNNGAASTRPALFRCNLDGTLCVFADLAMGQDAGTGSGGTPSAVIDAANGKLLVVTNDSSNNNKPSLFRCSLDGTSCSYADISSGQGAGSGTTPSAVIDTVNKKLLVVTYNVFGSLKPSLFRCNLDGTSCTYTDLSAGQGALSGEAPSAVIDTLNGRLLVVTQNGATTGNNKPSLFAIGLW